MTTAGKHSFCRVCICIYVNPRQRHIHSGVRVARIGRLSFANRARLRQIREKSGQLELDKVSQNVMTNVYVMFSSLINLLEVCGIRIMVSSKHTDTSLARLGLFAFPDN